MNQCRRCGAGIPDGEVLCESCKATDEGYLDSLLRSMDRTKTDHREDLPKKKNSISYNTNRAIENDDEDDLDREIRQKLGRKQGRARGRRRRSKERMERMDSALSPDGRDFSGENIADSLLDVLSEDEEGTLPVENPAVNESMAQEGADAPLEDDELLTMISGDGEAGNNEPEMSDDDLMAMLSEDSESEGGEGSSSGEDDLLAMLSEDDESEGGEASSSGEDDLLDMLSEDDESEGGKTSSSDEDDLLAMLSEDSESEGGEASSSGEDDLLDMLSEDDESEGGKASSSDDDDLLAMLSEDGESEGGESASTGEDDLMALLSEDEEGGNNEAKSGGEDDLMAILSEDEGEGSNPVSDDELMALMDSDDDSSEGLVLDGDDQDIFSLEDLMEDEEGDSGKGKEKSSDVGDIIADSLSAVSEDTEDSLEAQILNSVSENEEPGKKKKKKKEGKGLFAKLFGNVVDSKSQKQFEAQKAEEEKAEFKKTEKARIKAGNLTEEEQKQKEEKEAAIAQAKEEKKQKKEEKKAQAEAKKAEKLEKKKKLAEERAKEEALTVDEGRINRAGASIVFIFFAAVAAFILLGSNQFTYATSIKNAGNYFDKQKYNKAYNEVSGLKIRDKDEEIYSKIMTVMYVNKELNSYNNYYDIQHYGEALDSLLKGLKRYDKYISNARELGIESDLNYVRRQILAELKRTFQISEKEALSLNEIEDQEEYSKKVIEAAEIVTQQ